MWIADTDYGVAPEIKNSSIRTIQSEDLHYNDDATLLELLAEKINKANSIPIDNDGIFIMQGVIPAMWLTCKYACKPGEEAVVTNPMYFPFFHAAETTEGRKVFWPLEEADGYRFDIETIKEKITPKTKLMFICNPHNPTGRVMTKEELSAIADIVLDNDLIVMSDELWEDIIFNDRKHVSIASLDPEISNRTLTVFGFSKTYNVAGLQIGYAASTNLKMVKQMKKLMKGVFRGTTTVSKAVAKTILSGDVDYYVEEELKYLHLAREYSMKRLKNIDGVNCNSLEGTFLLFPNIKAFGKTSKEMFEYLLKEARVGVSEGSQFGSNGEYHVRINIGTSLNILKEAFDRIETSLKQLM